MSRRFSVSLAIVVLALSATAAWSFYKLAGAGETMIEAANKYIATLTTDQKSKGVLAYDDKQRIEWHFIPKPDPPGAGFREGMKVGEMNDGQLKAAHELLKAALSEAGYSKATQIMALEGLLDELEKSKTGNRMIRDTQRYFFTIYGTPNAAGKWGLGVEGHHLSLNFVVDKGHVASTTPSAFGANPAIVKSENVPSIKKGTRVLAKEESLAVQLVESLTADQKKEATIAEKPPGEVHNAGAPQPANDLPKGISAGKLTGEQKGVLRSLVEEYANSFPTEVAQSRMEAVRSGGIENIHFGWAGSTKEGEGRYYTVQGPNFQIEFINVQPDSAGNPANHIHSVWRDVRGDFAISAK